MRVAGSGLNRGRGLLKEEEEEEESSGGGNGEVVRGGREGRRGDCGVW